VASNSANAEGGLAQPSLDAQVTFRTLLEQKKVKKENECNNFQELNKKRNFLYGILIMLDCDILCY